MTKIMVVDDEPDLLEVVKLILESDGYQVVTANSGQEALDKIEKEMPDLVLLDIIMPRMDGWEVFSRIKGNTKTHDIPVIMLTAKDQRIDKLIGLHVVRVDDYITKPFGRAELLERIKRVLEEKHKVAQ
ncbi:putative response regulator [Methanocella paludicola SANAE]|uniref:Response regulator n=1 Tax=Methanocella paludicola (strain DSM 17711 / JCM 13418 / NBRC 101707 / SANAE) TaxID=304371 RepID=D1Z1T1_METPS|nr:response regulator [Methanocella paludicola]BAI62653.1 putative response regulator [Methanocella paludicola SANAE]